MKWLATVNGTHEIVIDADSKDDAWMYAVRAWCSVSVEPLAPADSKADR